MNQLIGSTLGNRYEIIEVLGTGGMAVVYKGRDVVLNRMVAIKVLKQEYNKTPEGLNDLVSIQQGILKNASEYVKVGGTLIYSTCTLNPAENQEIVKWFLGQNTRFEIDKIFDEKYITLFPNTHETDGFFIARLKKIE